MIPAVAKAQRVLTVAADGTGQFTTVQAAFDAIPYGNRKAVIVRVSNGVYHEKLVLDSTKNNVTLEGENRYQTILRCNDHTGKLSPNGDTINTYTSQSVLIKADNFTAVNVSFENTAGFNAGQAVAVQAAGNYIVFRNCRFIGHQDVLFTPRPGTYQYYEDCFIEGTTDFIFGAATVWFERCHINSRKNSHITAASTPAASRYGFIFNECVLTADTGLYNVSLGRPWRPHAATIFMNSYIGPHIRPEGWSVWNKNDNHLTARYAEFNNFGPSALPAKRLSWTKQLSSGDAKLITIQNVFGKWDPRCQ